MTVMVETELKLKHEFDPKRSRHYMNGTLTVLHCHHYASLYCQLADDAEIVDGKKLLFDAAEEAFFPILQSYYTDNDVAATHDRVTVAEQYFSAIGLGLLKVVGLGESSGVVELLSSHVDEGWKKKWGEREKPVNFIAQGFIAALFATVLGKSMKSFTVEETQCIVSGAEKSVFRVVSK